MRLSARGTVDVIAGIGRMFLKRSAAHADV